jgi:peptidoglycan/LPS O-acetylase OafA/YrhL
MFGLIQLPRWARDLRLGVPLILGATALSYYLHVLPKDTLLKNFTWFLVHPLWGLGFFILINRLVLAEQSWIRRTSLPLVVSVLATVGIFSYSLYLTHEVVVMVSWWFTRPGWLQSANALLLTLPATVAFAWVFFWFCERPFMVRREKKSTERQAHWTRLVESQPSTVSD